MTDTLKDRVNPFRTKMYYKLSFVSWLAVMRKQRRLEILNKANNIRKHLNEALGVVDADK